MISDYLKFAVRSLASRGLRSWLTMLGIFVGIAAVVALISLGQGLQNYIDLQFQKVGANRIIITPGGGDGGIAAVGQSAISSAKLRDHDLSIALGVNGVESGTGMVRRAVTVEYRNELKTAFLFGMDFSQKSLNYMKTVDWMTIVQGRELTNQDKGKALVSEVFANSTFKKPLNKGDKVTVDGVDVEFVGFMKKAGNPAQDQRIVMPLNVVRDTYGMNDELSQIIVSSMAGYNTTEVAENIKTKLRRDHGLAKGSEDFTVQTSEQLIKSFINILDVVQTVLAGIAGISLLVGGLGIMTTMYTSVLERTSQIGIMKAVGAKNKDIMTLFLMEAGILGALGGIIGVVLGMAISFAVEYVAQHFYDIELLIVKVDPVLILGALSFSFAVGCLSGLAPSIKAANMRPVDAIRYR